jgi:DNA-binding MarR family transcriptional regulator/ribosomal protein S18 acetylase RimI-like enzyme
MDVLRARPHLFLGSRLKRLGERMQADVLVLIERAGLPVQPAQYPILAALDSYGPLSVGGLVEATGVSQPGVTRAVTRLVEAGLVENGPAATDRRRRTLQLSTTGIDVVARSRAEVWPAVEASVRALCASLDGPLLAQLDAVERSLDVQPLHRRTAASRTGPVVEILPFRSDRAKDFHDINVQWIEAMFALEATDREVLENPEALIISQGGDILFAEVAGLGVVGTCALQKTGEGQFELTKMGVLEAARGHKVGEALLEAVLDRAIGLNAQVLYLMTNRRCEAAIHLYEKLGFRHDREIMERFGARYDRCDVAMRHRDF